LTGRSWSQIADLTAATIIDEDREILESTDSDAVVDMSRKAALHGAVMVFDSAMA
jgi:hypothetical protein